MNYLKVADILIRVEFKWNINTKSVSLVIIAMETVE